MFSGEPLLRGERAGGLSIVYVLSYLALGLPAVIAGVLAVHGGVLATAREYGTAVMVLSMLALAGLARRRVRGSAASRPLLTFHRVPEGKTVKNRLHLDLVTTRMAAETERLLSLGATRLWDVEKGDLRWTTFADPEGNEFDLIAR